MDYYDVALSFAGENRVYVEKIAFLLKMRGVNVFYDKYETSKLWGKDLYQYLSDIYKSKARYCIVFISKHYIEKNWTKLELRSAQEKSFLQDEEYILPIILENNVKIPGIGETTGFLKASEYTEQEIVDLIEEKLGRKIDRYILYNQISEYIKMMIISYCNIENEKGERVFLEYKDKLKTYLLKRAFDINKELFNFYLFIIEVIENRYKIELSQGEFQISLRYAYDIFYKANNIIAATDAYIKNNYNDEIDFYDLLDGYALFDNIEAKEELIKQFFNVVYYDNSKSKLMYWGKDDNENEIYFDILGKDENGVRLWKVIREKR